MAKLVIDFIAEFLKNPGFRFAVLRRERSTMLQYGLDETTQVNVLLRLNSTEIAELLRAEVTGTGADVDKLDRIINHNEPCDSLLGPLASPKAVATETLGAVSAYGEGKIHIRCVDATLKSGSTYDVTMRGHGFDYYPDFQFRGPGGPKDISPNALPSVANDLFQHVAVTVELLKGDWQIYAKNSEVEDFDDSTGTPGKLKIS